MNLLAPPLLYITTVYVAKLAKYRFFQHYYAVVAIAGALNFHTHDGSCLRVLNPDYPCERSVNTGREHIVCIQGLKHAAIPPSVCPSVCPKFL